MARPRRHDYRGAWHHVMNRGVGRRSVFETESEFRYLLARLARLVRKGLIEVHAFAIMPTHFHLLVRSKEGKLWLAMKELEEGYAQRFNRRRERPGPLFQSRYKAVLIESAVYWEVVFRYIDYNPVKAGLVSRPTDYPYGSARAYLLDRHRWLSRSVAQEARAKHADDPRITEDGFSVLPGGPLRPSLVAMVEEDLRAGRRRTGLIDDLIRMDVRGLRGLLQQRANSADGFGVVEGVLSPEAIREAIGVVRPPYSDASLLHAGLLRQLCAAETAQLASVLEVSKSTALRRMAEHQERVQKDPAYADLCAEVARQATIIEYPPPIVEPGFAAPDRG